jgi:hypothetical protein
MFGRASKQFCSIDTAFKTSLRSSSSIASVAKNMTDQAPTSTWRTGAGVSKGEGSTVRGKPINRGGGPASKRIGGGGGATKGGGARLVDRGSVRNVCFNSKLINALCMLLKI